MFCSKSTPSKYVDQNGENARFAAKMCFLTKFVSPIPIIRMSLLPKSFHKKSTALDLQPARLHVKALAEDRIFTFTFYSTNDFYQEVYALIDILPTQQVLVKVLLRCAFALNSTLQPSQVGFRVLGVKRVGLETQPVSIEIRNPHNPSHVPQTQPQTPLPLHLTNPNV